ncbi:glycosyltransferase [Ruania suaedae]|uniref:glycosyltransferase n=1 Tax=Ruania suaedae TaxID=2897774 RepID=UPI001E489EDB|nr:glycosyltransferase [Ruania suaedae]UFU03490.1 glycosyltransferase [Ruania suaedae]
MAQAGSARSGAPLPGEPGRGALGRTTLAIHWALVLTVCCGVAAAPGLVALGLLDGAASPWAVGLALLPVGPAVSATLYAWREQVRSEEHTAPWRAFRRGYARGVVDVLRVWVPALAVLTLIGSSALAVLAGGAPRGYLAPLAVLAVLVLLASIQALVIATFFSFRTRDALRLAVHHVFRMPATTVSVLALVICAVGVLWLAGDGVLVLLGGVFAFALRHADTALVAHIERHYTAP